MEPDISSNGPVKPPPLNSDQLNYLIWRYLQESGYGDAAVKLQRDWKVDAESLPFAKHIKGQALISLVQKGLRYHHLSLTIDERGRSSKKLEPAMYFFGPEDVRPDTSASESLIRPADTQRPASPLSTTSNVPRKRETESNGLAELTTQSHKRSRKTAQPADRNGASGRKPSTNAMGHDPSGAMDVDLVNGTGISRSVRSPSTGENLHDETMVNGANLDFRMDVDIDAQTPSSTDPLSHDPIINSMPPLVHTLTNGESVGVQVAPAKVVNLGPSATLLSVAENLHVNKTAWRPGDKSILAASGHNFVGCWRLAGSNSPENGAKMPFEELSKPEHARLITAFAWAANGSALAIATYAEQGGQIDIYVGHELTLLETLPGSQREITSLKWLPGASSLVGIVPGDEVDVSNRSTASILTWDVSATQDGPKSPESQEAPNFDMLLDMDTAEEQGTGLVYVAGRRDVYRYSYKLRGADDDGRQVRDMKSYQPPAQIRDGWSFIRCRSQLPGEELAIVASADSACLWIPQRGSFLPEAHSAAITGLELRPRAFQQGDEHSVPEFATSSVDGSVKIWKYEAPTNSIQLLHRITIDQSSPIMALSYSPDGFCVAGASYNQVHIWNAEHGYNLMASWQGTDSEWKGSLLKEEDVVSNGGMSSVNGDSGATASEHNLAWDTDSKKLAFGLVSQASRRLQVTELHTDSRTGCSDQLSEMRSYPLFAPLSRFSDIPLSWIQFVFHIQSAVLRYPNGWFDRNVLWWLFQTSAFLTQDRFERIRPGGLGFSCLLSAHRENTISKLNFDPTIFRNLSMTPVLCVERTSAMAATPAEMYIAHICQVTTFWPIGLGFNIRANTYRVCKGRAEAIHGLSNPLARLRLFSRKTDN